MNRKRALILDLLLVGIVIAAGSPHGARAQSNGKTRADGEQDVLLKLLTANLKDPFGKTIDNGFEIAYEISGKTVTASSAGGKLSGFRIDGTEVGEQSAMVKAVTVDKAVEITTYFFFNKDKQKLTIDRRLRNISGKTVNVKMMREYVDPKLVLGEEIKSGQRVSSNPKEDSTVVQVAGQNPNLSPKDCECPEPPPPCKTIICPPGPMYAPARLIQSARVFVLEWTIPGQKGTSVLPASRVQSVTELAIAGGRP